MTRPASIRPGAGLLVASILLFGACGDRAPARQPSAALPPGPPVVEVTMKDYRFIYGHAVPSGRVVFRLRNRGAVLHDMALVPIGDDVPPINEQLHGEHRSLARSLAGSRALDPGTTGAFAVDLAPGVRYAILCTVYDRSGKSHALKGMNGEFRTPPRHRSEK